MVKLRITIMKIAVISDSHDHILNLKKTLELAKREAKILIHCGDIVSPFTMEIISQAKLKTYVFLGNNDGDKILLEQKCGENIDLVPPTFEFGEIEIEGKKIAFCHFPKIANFLAKEQTFDAVFYGHTHLPENKKIGKTLLLNPGAVCGIQRGEMGTASFALYNIKTNQGKIIEIKY